MQKKFMKMYRNILKCINDGNVWKSCKTTVKMYENVEKCIEVYINIPKCMEMY